jgi:2C-methyl-D-erythritol 2,4-cyclodiphosphate synthase
MSSTSAGCCGATANIRRRRRPTLLKVLPADGDFCPAAAVNIKATINEAMGFVGRGEGMAAQAVALVAPIRAAGG